MTTPSLPTSADLQKRLIGLTQAQLTQISSDTGVPLSTILKLRNSSIRNPRLDTVNRLWPALQASKT